MVQLNRRKATVVLVSLALALIVGATIASAHLLGGRFSYSRGWLYLDYTQRGDYRTQVLAAANSWLNTPTVIWPRLTTNYSTSEIDFYTGNYGNQWWGLTVHHPSCTNCQFVWADEYLNSQTLRIESASTRQKVAAHEFGHGFGLAHPCTGVGCYFTPYKSVMKQGFLSYNTPQTHDSNDTNSLYPYRR
jgi:hypothetical protein